MSNSVTGVVKFFNDEKGYGFITPDGGQSVSADVFVHKSEVTKANITKLVEGSRVSFVPAEGRQGKGKRATELSLIA